MWLSEKRHLRNWHKVDEYGTNKCSDERRNCAQSLLCKHLRCIRIAFLTHIKEKIASLMQKSCKTQEAHGSKFGSVFVEPARFPWDVCALNKRAVFLFLETLVMFQRRLLLKKVHVVPMEVGVGREEEGEHGIGRFQAEWCAFSVSEVEMCVRCKHEILMTASFS